MLRYDDPVLARIWQLVSLVEGPFDDERVHAIRQLGVSRTTEKSTLSALVKAAGTSNPVIRKACVVALGKIGLAAAEAVPALFAAPRRPRR